MAHLLYTICKLSDIKLHTVKSNLRLELQPCAVPRYPLAGPVKRPLEVARALWARKPSRCLPRRHVRPVAGIGLVLERATVVYPGDPGRG